MTPQEITKLRKWIASQRVNPSTEVRVIGLASNTLAIILILIAVYATAWALAFIPVVYIISSIITFNTYKYEFADNRKR